MIWYCAASVESACVQLSDRWQLKQPKHLFGCLSPVIAVTHRYVALLRVCFGAGSRRWTQPAVLKRQLRGETRPRCFSSKRVPLVACATADWPRKLLGRNERPIVSCMVSGVMVDAGSVLSQRAPAPYVTVPQHMWALLGYSCSRPDHACACRPIRTSLRR